MDNLIYLLITITLTISIYVVIVFVSSKRVRIRERLVDVQGHELDEEDEMKKPFVERAIVPIYNNLFSLLERFTPKNIADNYQKILLQAGLAEKMSPIRILLNQILLSTLTFLLLILFFQSVGNKPNLLLIIIMTLIAFLMPVTFFRGKAKERQKSIKNSLPDILDMLYISVEAGLSFDAAMKKTALKMKGPLSTEIRRAMDDISKGREREEALRSIGERTQVEDVASFITAVIQSELLGANIANMLRIQSRVMREKRRQRAEEEAAKMPLKMLFPMIFLLFPALFIVILGPALLNIIAQFSKF